ncbi:MULTISPECIES: hypothetical protein [Kosmotoga]|jgi:hypothetical protein|uniref:Iron-only hydrogenase system regulator n=1 Tax=Kosmotoga olearia (strain ATCC BAA-1733 / DSM 21960 / TBF 19.5.1) TaxID=521045 RepID=C5CH17_KOSOT|nr:MULTISPECIES: hypothetical protein [Kosmotoga]ACR79682.1 conserved hypothetical protein [Kosmotoga olearia TBF 19.5.1]MDI3523874.1 hypothetical protein [Kosmotoga sp.]MDK2953658.1 hypothetical protein [Kosmotoga sp.]OAA21921.1 hypothetical protein DU53_05170 [Kosmotoga sp. DU53]
MGEKLPIKTVMAIIVDNRKNVAEKVQKLLTGWGCLIKTRLGLHDGVLDNCSDVGLIILELVGNSEQHEELCRKLNLLDGVSAKYMDLSFEENR